MKFSLSFRQVLLVGFALSLPLLVSSPTKTSASTMTGEDEAVEPQRSGELELPCWEVGESREGFDIRIWPEEVVIWLEQENLRDLISDPETSEEERASLRQILAQQRAWKTT